MSTQLWMLTTADAALVSPAVSHHKIRPEGQNDDEAYVVKCPNEAGEEHEHEFALGEEPPQWGWLLAVQMRWMVVPNDKDGCDGCPPS